MRIPPVVYPRELLELLEIHHFPGNIRELQSMVTDAVARNNAGVLSLEPFRRGIEHARSGAALKTSRTDIAVLQKKIEDIWGHIPTLDEAEKVSWMSPCRRRGEIRGLPRPCWGSNARQTLNMRLKARDKHG
jgi:DNA-binding NtrC family response regulator